MQTLLQTSVIFSLSTNSNLTQRSIADKPSCGSKTKRPLSAPLTCQISIAALELKLRKKPPPDYPKEVASACLGGSKPWQKSSPWSASLCKELTALLRILHILQPFFSKQTKMATSATGIQGDWFSSCVVQLCTGLSQKNIFSVVPYSMIQLVRNSSKKNLFLQTLVCKKSLFFPLKMMAFCYLPPPVEPW